ncbi:MAG: RNA polymerase sigma factor [bacterium JZ-2024 1]
MEQTVREMVERAQRGEAEAMGELIEAFSSRIFAFFYSRFANRAFAEDLVQETFLKAWERITQLRDVTKFVPWLYSIARHCLCDAMYGKYKTLPVEESLYAGEEDPVEAVEREEEIKKLERLLRKLPEEYWMPLWLKEWENMSYEEIADSLNIPVGTVRSRLARARKKLLQMWEESK